MSFTYIRRFPTVEEILESQPLSTDLLEIKAKRDREIAAVFTGEDRRFILVVGPCSAHDSDAMREYVDRLAVIQGEVVEKVIIIPRIYTNKPRTTGTGYKGMFHQPDHQADPDMTRGLKTIRDLHINCLASTHLPAADEMLYPGNYPYLADLLAYVAIGARSVENQQHRLTVSGLEIPTGMKNPTSGDFRVMLDSVFAAQQPHMFIYNRWEVSTNGNPLTHCVVRGSVDRHGNHMPNYHYEDLIQLAEMYLDRGLANPAVVVDINHSNSAKKFREQPRIAMEVINSIRHTDLLRRLVKGLMIESFLLEGSQPATGMEFGKSITDPCLGWDDTARLIREIASAL